MMTEKRKSFMDSPEWRELQEKAELASLRYEKECEEYWDNLSYEDKLKAFYSVVKRLVKGEIKENRSYRGVLYDVFGFDMDSYGIGMECGYMELHNSIIPKDEQAEYREWWYEKYGGKMVDKVTVKLDKDDDDAEV
jgi:hypothetical protein